MNCDQISLLLDPYADGEFIDAIHNREIESHLATCEECQKKLDALRAVSRNVREQGFSYQAPNHLYRNIASIGVVEPKMTKPLSDRGRLAWSFASFCVVAAVLMLIVFSSNRPNITVHTDMEVELVSAHIRSLQVAHLFDVKSTDKHSVKPWFQGKLNFSPDVPNLASDGFPLLGGRLDVISGRPVAALIYGRAKHFINVFVMPSFNGSEGFGNAEWEGYHLENWTEHGLDYWAVSDADTQAIQQFVLHFRKLTTQ
jgi:anti-sigma factor RsiW